MTEDEEWKRLREAAARYRNWGRWGPDDEAGTLNFITPEMRAGAAKLVRRGHMFSLAIPFDLNGPQSGGLRRFNPMLFMLRDGSDVVASSNKVGGADDVVMMPTHGATHWDALSHIIFDGKLYNGYDCAVVTSMGASKNGIESFKDRIAGRGVLLDVARYKGVDWLDVGYGITAVDLENTARAQKVAIGRGDIVLVRTGMIGMCRAQGSWGTYAGGDAPGLVFDTMGWIYEKEIAGIAADTWGCEVRPNEISVVGQPWHRVIIPSMGLLVGEIFDLDVLAADCAADGVYEFMFIAPPLPFTGAVGSPVNPIAIK